MTTNEILVWCETTFPMLSWKVGDWFGDEVVETDVKDWRVMLHPVNYEHGNISYRAERRKAYEGHGFAGFTNNVEYALRRLITENAPDLLEDVQMSLF